MIPILPVKLLIAQTQIRRIQDGIQTHQDLLMKSNAQPHQDNWSMRDPALYSQPNRMDLDLGRAHNLPAFEFSQVN